MQVVEGKTYLFKVISSIELGDNKYFTLSDSSGKKYLLPADQYKDYNIEEGENIKCKVDKINCSGKIFLEPEHPIYKQNHVYKFAYKGKTEIINSFGEKETHYIVTDFKENDLLVPVINNETRNNADDYLLLKIQSIKKGKPLLSYNYPRNNDSIKLKIGEKYKFTILGINTLIKDKEFIRLKDEFNNIHFIRYKFYKDFGFKPGTTVYCTLVNEEKYASYYLEPEYPGYSVNQIYDFEFIKKDKYYHKDGSAEECLVVLDKNGNECIVFYSSEKLSFEDKKTVKGKVEYVFKGKLFSRLVTG